MEGPVYRDVLSMRGLGHAIPREAQRAKIHAIIFEELVKGDFLEDSRAIFDEVALAFERQGCDAMVLGCTEIPLLVDPDDCPLPVLDSTRLLSRAALKEALS